MPMDEDIDRGADPRSDRGANHDESREEERNIATGVGHPKLHQWIWGTSQMMSATISRMPTIVHTRLLPFGMACSNLWVNRPDRVPSSRP